MLKDIQTDKEFVRKDSLQTARFLDSLAQNRYFQIKVQKVEQEDSTITVYFDKGLDFKRIKVFPSKDLQGENNLPAEFITENLDSLRLQIAKSYSAKGYPFNRVKATFQGFRNNLPTVTINIEKGQERTIDAIVMRGYEKIAPRFVRNLQKTYRGKTADKRTLSKLNLALANHPNFSLDRNPEILYTKNSTEVYLFINKKSSNSFDGIVGFGNDEAGKFSFNGNLNVSLQNVFNRFENISVSWQRTPQRAQQFDLQTDFPYLFNTNVGANFRFNIFRQDSSFATASAKPVLYYNLGTKHKIGLSATYETSAQAGISESSADFTRRGGGFWYRYFDVSPIEIFEHKTVLTTEFSLMNSSYGDGIKYPQQHFLVKGGHNINISKKHFVYLNGAAAAMFADKTLLSNEMLRIGGWNSLRGFGEESLLAKSYFFGGPEYRFLVNDKAFFDAFVQAGQITNEKKFGVYSFGAGFNMVVPIGLMSFQLSNGNTFNSPLSFAQTKIHWGVVTRF